MSEDCLDYLKYFTEILKLFQNHPILMLIALIALIYMVIVVTKKNKIGKITATQTKVKQSPTKGNVIDEIKSDIVEVVQD